MTTPACSRCGVTKADGGILMVSNISPGTVLCWTTAECDLRRLARIERAVADTEAALAEHCDRLREAADGLLVWWRSDRAGNGDRAGMHPKHVANRVRKIAQAISKAKEKK